MANLVKQFPKRLLWLRTKKGLTQPELDRIAGLSSNSVAQMEQGYRKISLPKLIKLADALEVSLDFLLGRWKKEPLKRDPDAPIEKPSQEVTQTPQITRWAGRIEDPEPTVPKLEPRGLETF